jgi:predicted CoA-substrate-specific enzyme activase
VVFRTAYDSHRSTTEKLEEWMGAQGFKPAHVDHLVACGHGRRTVPNATRVVTDVTACARGVHAICPEAKTVLDVGAHGVRVIRLTDGGQVAKFVMNDKCSAGTGCFLDTMARVLAVLPENVASFALASQCPEKINGGCTVFAESDVVSLVARGRKREDVLAGAVRAVCRRIGMMVRQIGSERHIVLTGGVAANAAVREGLEKELSVSILVPDEPQLINALGAANIGNDTEQSDSVKD